MSERDQSPSTPQPQWSSSAPSAPATGSPAPVDWREDTSPGGAAYSGAGASAVGADHGGSGGTVGSLGSGGRGYPGPDERSYTEPQYSTSPVTVRRPDALAALLLVLAGIAAAVSLLLDWVSGSTGWDLVQDGFEDFDSGSWQPPVVVLAGGVLFVLGLLMFLPGRSHRTLGVLALLVSLPALVGIAVVLNLSDFTVDVFEIGFWVAAAVPVLGLLGAIKAMVTAPRVR